MSLSLNLANRSRPLLLDAPVGAELVRRGVRWRKHGLLTDADQVQRLHAEFLAAGAELIRANTLGLNGRIFLDVFRSPAHMAHIGAPGLDTLAPRLAAKAIQVARAARDESGRQDVPVAGVLSPLEHAFRPDLVPDEQTARREHGELAAAMAGAGADLLYLDAFTTVREARAAAGAATQTGLPFVLAFTVDERGDLLGGESTADAARLAAEVGAQALVLTGAPLADLQAARARLGSSSLPLGIAPMCGYFDPPSWKFDFHPRFGGAPPPEQFTAELAGAADGLALVGPWCGASPGHVGALRERIGGVAAR